MMFDLDSGAEETLIARSASRRSLNVSPDGRYLLGQVGADTFLWDLDSGAVRGRQVVTRGARLSWMPDSRILVQSQDGIYRLARADAQNPVATSAPFLSDLSTQLSNPIFAPSADFVATLVEDPTVVDPEIEEPQPGMYTIARPFRDLHLISATDGSTLNLTEKLEDQVSDPVWSHDGASLFFKATDNVDYEETIYKYTPATSRLRALITGSESYSNLQATPQGLLVSIQSATRPADLWLLDTSTGNRRRATHLNPQLDRFEFSAPELFHFHDADGTKLGALIYRPTMAAPEEGFPVVTYVYEKLTPGMHRFSAQHQILLSHGYAVLMPNVKIKIGEPGDSFVKAIVPAVNAVRGMGFTNGRFALWGGSWGAYATAFAITQTHIFDCAVVRATPPELFRNWASGRDRDSNNIESGQARIGGNPFEVMERYFSQSPFFHLDKVETPVLIMHGVKDYTILFGEGEMMFYALRRLGKEATFVVYQEGDHSLSRGSRSDTLDVNQRMLDWFGKHLRPAR